VARITEAEFQAQVIALAKLRGWRVAHFRGTRTMRKDGSVRWMTPVQADGAGFPDLVLLKGERLLVIELKRSRKERPTVEQERWLQAFMLAGVSAAVWSPEDWGTIERVLGL
jgi:hypothetical protein